MADHQESQNGFVLGIDLGTTYAAAAIMRGAAVEICVLGTIAAQIPAVVVHREDSEILTGEAAERRATSEPTRTAREFKRRLGDPVPIIVGGTPYGAEALMAELLEAIVGQVTRREGQEPNLVVLTHPANYSEYKRGLLLESARLAGLGLDRVRLITEPEAAAIAYAHQQRIDPGEIIAVYDFGGGTFDAAVVRDTADGFELIGTPEGMERLGGIDFDQAVLFHVDAVLDGMVSSADSADPQVLAGQARLRDECRRAKEALSSDTDATIAVSIPGVQTEVRLTRDELEQMVRPRIAETVRALQRTIASAGITADDVSRVLLVGGSSRMPIVAQVIRETLGRPVSTDADPKLAIAIGAALSAAPTPPAPPVAMMPPAADPHTREPTQRRSTRHSGRRWGVVAAAVAAAVAGVAVAAIVIVKVVGSGDEPTKSSVGASPLPVTITDLPPGTASSESQPTAASVASVGTGATAASTGVSVASEPGGPVERLAFDGSDQGSGIPGAAVAAGIPGALHGLAVAPNGDVFLTSTGISVLKVSDGTVEVVAGFISTDVTTAGIAIGSDEAVFVTTPDGVVRVRDGVRELVLDGPAAGLSSDLGPLAFDGGGNLYIADNGTSRIVRQAPDGALTLVAGTGTPATAGSDPVEGAVAASSEIGVVTGLVVDRDGNLLIADAGLQRVRAVARDGTITTLAGGGSISLDSLGRSGAVDTATVTDLAFSSVDDIALDRHGRVYVADGAGRAIVRFGSDGIVELVLRSEPGGDASAPGGVIALAISPSGALIFSDGLALWSMSGVAEPG